MADTASYGLTLDSKQATEVMMALGRFPVDQIGETYLSIKSQLQSQGFEAKPQGLPIPSTAMPPPEPPPSAQAKRKG